MYGICADENTGTYIHERMIYSSLPENTHQCFTFTSQDWLCIPLGTRMFLYHIHLNKHGDSDVDSRTDGTRKHGALSYLVLCG